MRALVPLAYLFTLTGGSPPFIRGSTDLPSLTT